MATDLRGGRLASAHPHQKDTPGDDARLTWTPAEAAPFLGVTLRAFWRRIRAGQIPPDVLIHLGNRYLVRRAAFLGWLEGRERST